MVFSFKKFLEVAQEDVRLGNRILDAAQSCVRKMQQLEDIRQFGCRSYNDVVNSDSLQDQVRYLLHRTARLVLALHSATGKTIFRGYADIDDPETCSYILKKLVQGFEDMGYKFEEMGFRFVG